MFASRSDSRGGGFQKAFSDELLHAYVLGGDGNESDGDSGDDMGVGVGLDLDDDWNGQVGGCALGCEPSSRANQHPSLANASPEL